MKFVLTLLAVFFTALPAFAQNAGGPISDVLFGAEEKRIITDYLKTKMGLPNAGSASTAAPSESDDDDDMDRAKGKKDKKNKKNRGKGKKKKMPPGLAKRGELPPGLAKRRTLPPGLQVRELPEDLVEQLPPPPAGQQVILADENVVLIEQATGRVLDIIFGNAK